MPKLDVELYISVLDPPSHIHPDEAIWVNAKTGFRYTYADKFDRGWVKTTNIHNYQAYCIPYKDIAHIMGYV